MAKKILNKYMGFIALLVVVVACKTPHDNIKANSKNLPDSYNNSKGLTNSATINWQSYFGDSVLIALVDTALKNNQELNIALQEIEISKNEVRLRKGEYMPFVGLNINAGIEKEGRYTRNGAVDETLHIKPGTIFPEPLPDYMFGAYASWEIDVWKKLRNAKKSAVMQYLASIEGKNFMVTNLIAEIADVYYELMALDNLLDIITQNIAIQADALKIVKQQKEAAKVSQLAVNRFQAQLLNTQNLGYAVKQKIVETQNRIYFLTGKFPNTIRQNVTVFNTLAIDTIDAGLPSQLLNNRADIRRAELELAAAKLDVKVAKANFYPSLGISSAIGFQAFNPVFVIKPESMFYNLVGDLMAPLINRNAIKAVYYNANAKQLKAIYQYEQTVLNAYVDVLNQLSKTENYRQSYQTKHSEVEILTQAVAAANGLFNSARADYGEVLLTQREMLDAKMELIEIKLTQLKAKVNTYRALGGGWH